MAQQSRGSIALQAIQNAATNLRSVASAAIQSAYRPISTTDTPQNLSDFGIQDETRADPLLSGQDYGYEDFATNHQGGNSQDNVLPRGDYIFLDNFRLMPKRDGWGAVANLDLFFTVRRLSPGRVYVFIHTYVVLLFSNCFVRRFTTTIIIVDCCPFYARE